MIKPPDGTLVPVLTPDQIQERVRQVARDISRDLGGTGTVPLMVGVLKGAFVFMADLVRAMTIPVEVDFVHLSSYGDEVRSSGRVRVLGDIGSELAGRDVVLVEDIIDTGLTLRQSVEKMRSLRPRSFRVCALVRKSRGGDGTEAVDYVGFDGLEGFLVGYGLDRAERYRELPGLYRIR